MGKVIDIDPIIPVLCENTACETLWFAISPIGISVPEDLKDTDSLLVTVRGVSVFPCPSCGGSGHMPDMDITLSKIELVDSPTNRRIGKAFETIGLRMQHGVSLEEATEEAVKDLPRSEATTVRDIVKRYIPKDLADLKRAIDIVVMIGRGILALIGGDDANIIGLHPSARDAIESVVESDQEDADDHDYTSSN